MILQNKITFTPYISESVTETSRKSLFKQMNIFTFSLVEDHFIGLNVQEDQTSPAFTQKQTHVCDSTEKQKNKNISPVCVRCENKNRFCDFSVFVLSVLVQTVQMMRLRCCRLNELCACVKLT